MSVDERNEHGAAPEAPPEVAPEGPPPEVPPEAAAEGAPAEAPPEAAEPARAASDGEAADAVTADLEELAGKARERDEYLALAQRTQADFENYRKRMAREISSAESRGVGRLAKELLPALDNVDLALAHARDADPELAKGFELVRSELVAALGRVGIEPYSPKGEQFDPSHHEAMAQHPVEGAASGTIVEVYAQGYRHGEVVLRPARVVVAA